MAPSSDRGRRLGALARTRRPPAPTGGSPVPARTSLAGSSPLSGEERTRAEGHYLHVEERFPDPSGPFHATGGPAEVFLDLETCGFAGTPLFLVGLLTREAGAFRLVQLLARHYGEERAVVAEARERLQRFPKWLSFNGKAYDLPFLRGRAGLHGLLLEDPEEHRDLLHDARRRYRHELPDCRLQTLEFHVLQRLRPGDLPGREIPALYHEAVREGRPDRLRSVLVHNRHDLVTLALLAARLSDSDVHRSRRA